MTVYDQQGFVTLDSGVREEYPSGMRRDSQEGKPRFALLAPRNVPYEHTMVYRDAMLSSRGAAKYEARNNEQAHTEEELDRFLESACRHFEAWKARKRDEDHAAAARWNIRNYEETSWRLANGVWSPDDLF